MQNFDKIYQDNYPKMYCVALKMIRDKDAVYDILQDVFAYYYRKLQKGHIVLQPKSWLYKATIHKCIAPVSWAGVANAFYLYFS